MKRGILLGTNLHVLCIIINIIITWKMDRQKNERR